MLPPSAVAPPLPPAPLFCAIIEPLQHQEQLPGIKLLLLPPPHGAFAFRAKAPLFGCLQPPAGGFDSLGEPENRSSILSPSSLFAARNSAISAVARASGSLNSSSHSAGCRGVALQRRAHLIGGCTNF